tara:strand:+ start:53 stop:187 length:135 start_codon:yes stop_codon:yes gene_type:complete
VALDMSLSSKTEARKQIKHLESLIKQLDEKKKMYIEEIEFLRGN